MLLARRQFVLRCWTAVSSAWMASASVSLAAVPLRLLAIARRPRGARPEYLAPVDAADVDAIASCIFPTDDTVGAREIGVVRFIDHALATWAAGDREAVRAGLDDLARRARELRPAGRRFARLSPDEQVAVLRTIEDSPFFGRMRALTVMGMFSSPAYGGNVHEAGWRLIGFDARHTWEPPFGYYDAKATRP